MKQRPENKLIYAVLGFFLILVFVLVLNKINFSFFSSPTLGIQKKVSRNVYEVKNSLRSAKNALTTKAQGLKLEETSQLLQVENEILKAEIKRLKRNANIKTERNDFFRIKCRANVISANPDWFINYYMLDKGAYDGIEEGDGVLYGANLLGRIINVAATTSQVQLITDPKSSVSARTDRGRVVGIVTGKGVTDCELQFVPKEEDVKENDIVVTSGLSTSLPEAIPIGIITYVKKPDGELSLVVKIKPFVNIFSVEEVAIIKKR